MPKEVDISELLDFGNNVLDMVRDEFPKELNKFMKAQGDNLKAEVMKVADARVKRKTGRYHESIKRGKVYAFRNKNNKAVRVYSTAPHAHFVEYGHKYKLNGSEGFAKGKYVFETAIKNYEPEFARAAEEFVDSCVEKMGD